MSCRVVLVEAAFSRGDHEQGDLMSQYMLLLYAPEVDEAEQAQREAEFPLWVELNESLQEAGLLVATVCRAERHDGARAR
jgi:hypothetical protein